MSADAIWTVETIPIAGLTLRLGRAGAGPPALVLPHDIGAPHQRPFHDALASHFTVLAPSHPGYDGSERPEWLRTGFGGWIAAEMATMAPRAFSRLVLVGALGIKPGRGEIADQALLSYIDYARLGFADQGAFDRLFGADPPTSLLEQWDLNREMTFRIAWKPYMYNPTLPHLLGGLATPTLVVWGRHDRIVPLECGERYVKALAGARLEVIEGAGHFVDMEKPRELAQLVAGFLSA